MNDNDNTFSPGIGFIGAGKVGNSLGKLMVDNGITVSGYYSRSPESAKAAASFTDTSYYESIETLIKDCDMIFLTVPDSTIREVWSFVSECDISGRIICHCSGAMASSIFTGCDDPSVSFYSIHPMYAISSRETGFIGLSDAVFSIEGSADRLELVKNWLEGFVNNIVVISSENKIKYHAAAVFASNLAVGLYYDACRLLIECGFDEETAGLALGRLFEGNCSNIIEKGPIDALTGPVERNDVKTVAEHIKCLDGNNTNTDFLNIYQAISRSLVEIGNKKHPEYDYSELLNLLK